MKKERGILRSYWLKSVFVRYVGHSILYSYWLKLVSVHYMGQVILYFYWLKVTYVPQVGHCILCPYWLKRTPHFVRHNYIWLVAVPLHSFSYKQCLVLNKT